MKRALWVVVLAFAAGCSHGIRNLSDCGDVKAADRRIECGACVVKNKADGVLGTWEYKPDASGDRCVRVD